MVTGFGVVLRTLHPVSHCLFIALTVARTRRQLLEIYCNNVEDPRLAKLLQLVSGGFAKEAQPRSSDDFSLTPM